MSSDCGKHSCQPRISSEGRIGLVLAAGAVHLHDGIVAVHAEHTVATGDMLTRPSRVADAGSGQFRVQMPTRQPMLDGSSRHFRAVTQRRGSAIQLFE